jgi:hypothetical protein
VAGIEIGDHAQEQALAGAGGSGDRQALAGGELDIEWAREVAEQVDDAQAG